MRWRELHVCDASSFSITIGIRNRAAAVLLTIHPSTAPSSEEPVTVGSYLSSLGARAQLQVSLYRRKSRRRAFGFDFPYFLLPFTRAPLLAQEQSDLSEFALLLRL